MRIYFFFGEIMPIHDVGNLARELHAAGVVNLDTKIGDVLKITGVGQVNHGSLVSSGAVAWDGYAVVYKGMPAGLGDLTNLVKPGGGGV
jgi:hypothetical protein